MTQERPGRKVVRRKPAAVNEEAVRARADALHRDGMPFQMAMAVAHGRMDLSEALERMARKDRVERLVEEHGLTRALATQVAMGHADLNLILRRQRLEAHRTEHRDRTWLEVGRPVTLGLHGKRVVTGQIQEATAYSLLFRHERADGEPEEIHKLQVKYAYAPDDWKRAKKAMKIDKALAAIPREPVVRPQDRYGCSDRRLFTYLDKEQDITVTLLEGEILRGRVTWFSRYEIGLEIRGEAEIGVFRHALHHVGT